MSDLTDPAGTAPGPSHTYALNWPELCRNFLFTLGTAGLLAALAIGFCRSPWAPQSTYRSDPDSAIIATKAALASSEVEAGIAFVGDSSCLIDVDIDTVAEASGSRAVNLGTLSYLGLDSFGALASQFARKSGASLIVLVLHPEALRNATTSEAHRRILESALGHGAPVQLRTNNLVAAWLGLDELRARVVDRWFPEPLRGDFGARYGFTEFLQAELVRRHGSLDETARFDPSTNRMSGEYRLANRIQKECEQFRSQLPAGTRIKVIITPVPQSHALKSHSSRVSEMQKQLETWLSAETWSINLPSTLPDSDFGTVTHLLPEAARRYSRQLAEGLRSEQ